MTASHNTGDSTTATPFRSRFDRLLSLSRYDLLLAAIPLVFALALSAHLVLSVPVRLAVASGGLSSTLLLADAMYLNPPTGPGSGGTSR